MKILTSVLAGTVLITLTACAAPGYRSESAYSDYGRSDYPDYRRSDYGVIESITLEEPRDGIGVGAVAGGVVGGLLGNQIGKGKGNTAATIAGAAGGAYVGHQIEKSQRSGPVYRITVRMEDGGYQTVTQDANTSLRVGDRVRVVDSKVYPF